MIVHPNPLEVAAAEATLTDAPTEVVMDDMVDSAKAINEASEQLGEISRNVEDLGNAAVSVESYMNNFLEAFSAENWSPRIAHQYQIGMEAILKATNSSAPSSMFCASFEAAGVTQTNEENRGETQAKSGNVVKRLWEAFLKLLQQLWDKTQDFITFFGASSGKLRKLASNLKARVATMRAGGQKWTYPAEVNAGPWASYLNGAPGNPSAALEGLASKAFHLSDTWYDTYLTAIRDVASRNLTSIGGAHPDASDAKSIEEEIGNLLNPKLKELSGTWMGGYEVVVQRKEDILQDFEITVKRQAAASKNAKCMTFSQVQELAGTINEVAAMIEHEVSQMYKGRDTIKAVKAKMEAAIKGGEKPANSNALSVARDLVSGVLVGPRKVLPLVTNNCVMAAQHANASLSVFKKQAK